MTDPVASPVIAVDDLRVRYPGASTDAVAGLSFEVHAGEVFGFLGPNGSGKSTTQRVLTRLLRRFSGTVNVLGRPLDGWGAEYYERIGVGFEQPAAFGRLTGRENLIAFARLYRRPTLAAAELLDAVALAEAADRPVRTYSKGMRVRLDLARALIHQPDLIFLDEPTSGLDPVQARAVQALVKAQADEGHTVFLTTHDMTAAQRLCDRVAFLHTGRIVALGTPEELMRTVSETGRSDAGRSDAGGSGAHGPDAHGPDAGLDDVFVAVTGRSK